MPDTPCPDTAPTSSARANAPLEARQPDQTTSRQPVAGEEPPPYRRPWLIPTDPPAV